MIKSFLSICLLLISHFASAQFSNWQWVPQYYYYNYFTNSKHVCSLESSYSQICYASTDSNLFKISTLNTYEIIYAPLDSALKGSEVTALTKESSKQGNINQLAIGTTNGLFLWNMQDSYTYFNSNNSPLPNDTINFIYQFGSMLWLCTNGGLATYSNLTETWEIFNTSNSPIPSNHINCILAGYFCFWIGTDSGIAIKNNLSWKILNTNNSGLVDNDITAIYFGGKNQWIGTRSKGLCDTTTSGNWSYLNSGNGLLSDSINFIDIDWNNWWPHNGFLVGTNGAGLLACQDSTEYLAQLNSLAGIPFNNAYDISFNWCFECIEGWIGTDKGILYSTLLSGSIQSISGDATLSLQGYFENDFLYAELKSSTNEKVTITLCDLRGRVFFNTEKVVHLGLNNVVCKIRNLPAGIYLLNCISENEYRSVKILKEN